MNLGNSMHTDIAHGNQGAITRDFQNGALPVGVNDGSAHATQSTLSLPKGNAECGLQRLLSVC